MHTCFVPHNPSCTSPVAPLPISSLTTMEPEDSQNDSTSGQTCLKQAFSEWTASQASPFPLHVVAWHAQRSFKVRRQNAFAGSILHNQQMIRRGRTCTNVIINHVANMMLCKGDLFFCLNVFLNTNVHIHYPYTLSRCVFFGKAVQFKFKLIETCCALVCNHFVWWRFKKTKMQE